MRPRFALLVALTACGRVGFGDGGTSHTSLEASISAATGVTIASLDARFVFASLDPGALYAVPAQGGAPELPGEVVFPLPDVSGPLTITVDALDARGRELSATATADVVADQQATVAVVIGGDLPVGCFDSVTDGGESDIDCGGPCPACPIGGACLVSTDCVSASCITDRCEPSTGPPSWLPIAEMPVGRIGLAAERANDDRIYVYGGSLGDDAMDYAEVDVYDPARDLWGSAPVLPTPRERITGAVDGAGNLYAIGGSAGSFYFDTVERFAPGDVQWTTAPKLPTARADIAAVADGNGTIYAFGGANGAPLSENDVLGTAWTTRAPLPATRTNPAAARATDGTLYVVGGYSPTDISASAVVYDPTTDVWSTLLTMQHARSDLAAAAAPDGRIYAIGGFDGDSGVTFVEAARLGASWIDVAPLSTGRDSCAATVGPDGRIFVFGGRADDIDGQTSAEAYGPKLQIGAAAGSAGDSVAVTGSNFAANATVRIYVDAIPVELATTDAAGSLPTSDLIVPPLASGPHVVRAIDDHAGYPVSLPFTIE